MIAAAHAHCLQPRLPLSSLEKKKKKQPDSLQLCATAVQAHFYVVGTPRRKPNISQAPITNRRPRPLRPWPLGAQAARMATTTTHENTLTMAGGRRQVVAASTIDPHQFQSVPMKGFSKLAPKTEKQSTVRQAAKHYGTPSVPCPLCASLPPVAHTWGHGKLPSQYLANQSCAVLVPAGHPLRRCTPTMRADATGNGTAAKLAATPTWCNGIAR